MAKIASFRQLIAWQKAMDLAETCYVICRELPDSEEFVLGAQLRKAAISVPSNIAEGQRLTTRSFRAHLRIALGSAAEIETQMELARRLGFVTPDTVDAALTQAEEVARLLRGLMVSLPRTSPGRTSTTATLQR